MDEKGRVSTSVIMESIGSGVRQVGKKESLCEQSIEQDL